MNSETDPAPATKANDSNEKSREETTKSNGWLLIIAAVVLVSLIIIIIIIVVFPVMKDSKDDDKFVAKAKAKCEEYAQLACTLESRIDLLHGKDPSPDIVPYMAYIKVPGLFPVCTGTLISEWFVLTAAHCFNSYEEKDVVSGYLASVSKQNVTESPLSVHSFNSTKIYIHEKFNKNRDTTRLEADIALIKMSEKVILSASVRPICLNTKLQNTAGDFISAGYGLIEGDNELYRLRMVETRMDGEVQKKCLKEYNYADFTMKLICAAHPTEELAGSSGDTGGPLMYPLKHRCPNVHEQIGVLAKIRFFDEHDPPETLYLYTKVEYYLEWTVKIVWPDPN